VSGLDLILDRFHDARTRCDFFFGI
jgi:hypothetical protein